MNGSHLTVAVTEINSAGVVFQQVWLAAFSSRAMGKLIFAMLLNQC